MLGFFSDRWRLWRQVTDQRLQNQQGDLLRIEQKLDDMDFRLHRTMGEHAMRLDDLSMVLGQASFDTDAVRAAELTVASLKELRKRVEHAEKQLAHVLQWSEDLEAWLKDEPYETAPPDLLGEAFAPSYQI